MDGSLARDTYPEKKFWIRVAIRILDPDRNPDHRPKFMDCPLARDMVKV